MLALVAALSCRSTGTIADTGGATGGSVGTGGGAGAVDAAAGTGGSATADAAAIVDAAFDDASGADGGEEGGGGMTEVGLDGAAAAKRVFVTRALYSGKLGGVDGADALCTAAAAAASLGGTWVAWLSAPQSDAVERIGGAGPWRRTDGVIAFPDRPSLEVAPSVPLSLDERGASVLSTPPAPLGDPVWTGTFQNGTRDKDHLCADWAQDSSLYDATVGDAGDAGRWTAAGYHHTCNKMARLYCFEQ